MKRVLALIPLASLALAGCADNTPGGLAVKARHQHFEALGDSFKAVQDQLKKPSPDLAAIRADADKIATLAPQLKDWFPAGSGPQNGKRTDAKAEVWTQPGEFSQAAQRLVDGANAFKTAAAGSDAAAVGAAAKTLGAACKGCHDKYKKD